MKLYKKVNLLIIYISLTLLSSCDSIEEALGTAPKNLPPTISAPDSAEGSYINGVSVPVRINDPDTYPISIYVYVDTPSPNTTFNASFNDTFDTFFFSASRAGLYRVKLEANDGKNKVSTIINILLKNLQPTYDSFDLLIKDGSPSPTIETKFTNLSDPEYMQLTIQYEWYVNNVLDKDETTESYPWSKVKKGDLISVIAIVSDGDNTLKTEKITRTVNLLPTISSLSLFPNIIYTGTDIEAKLGKITDPEGDQTRVQFHWYINDKLIENQTSSVLPSNLTKKDDKIKLRLEISDTFASSFSEVEATVADSPVTYQILNFPSTVTNGSLVEFDVLATDPDQSGPISVELAYGPSGMSISASGHISWTPDEIMFSSSETFHFGLSNSVENGNIVDKTIQLQDSNRKLLLARSGIQAPTKNKSIWVADYDNDGKNEILTTDSSSRVYTLEYDGKNYIQDWMYPFTLPSAKKIQHLLSHDINGDGKQDIIIVTASEVAVIEDSSKIARTLFSYTKGTIIAAEISNIDNDPALEIALLLTSANSNRLEVYQLDNWTNEFSKDLNEPPAAIVIGNIDNDSAKELIIDSGYVFDGITGNNEWYYPGGFGKLLTLGDIDNSGINKIIAAHRNKQPKIFNILDKTNVVSFGKPSFSNVFDLCSIHAANLDADPQQEIITGDCQWGNIHIFDISKSTSSPEKSWSAIESGAISVTSGDVNNDNLVEIIWGSGFASSGKDILAVASLDSSTPWSNQTPSQLDAFVATGWANITPGDKQAVFISPRTDSGYAGQRIVFMDETGQLTISNEINSNWQGSQDGIITDYDQDGYAEIFFATADLYDGDFQVRQLNNMTLEWGGTAVRNSQINAITAVDINNDSFDDAIVVKKNQLAIYDILKQTLLWQSPEIDYQIADFAVITSTTSTGIVIASDTELSIWKKDSNTDTYTKERSEAMSCKRLQVSDLDSNGSAEIICLYTPLNNNSQDYSSIALYDTSLQLIKKFSLNQKVSDFIVEETSTGVKNLLIASIGKEYPSFDEASYSQLSLVSSLSGKTVWQSQTLMGKIPARSMHYLPTSGTGGNKRITFGSSRAMFLSY